MPPRDVLNKIREQGVIHVGFQHHTPPFSYKVSQQAEPIGYSVDLCRLMLKALCSELGLGCIKVIPVEVTSSTRQGMLEQGLIDMECGSTSITPLRQEHTLFSQPVFYTAHRIALKKTSSGELAHATQTIRATGIENSTSHHAFLNWTEAPRPIEFLGCSSIQSAFEQFQQDPTVEAMVADEVILKSLLLQSNSNNISVSSVRLPGEPYGFMFRKEEFELVTLLNAQLSKVFDSEEFEKLYVRWFMHPLPDLNFNLQLPMPPRLRDSLRTGANGEPA